jgi:hypothetical protein
MKKLFLLILTLIVIINIYLCINYTSVEQKFTEYMKDKNIIIVGPADYVNNGKRIDSYDIVVRLNKGHNQIKNSDKYGSRTDILYHCISQDEENGGEIPKDKNIKFLKFAFPKKAIYGGGRYILKRDRINHVQQDLFNDFEKKLKTMPNTGTTAIWDILNYDIKSLHITGFTLFQTNYSKLYRETAYGESGNTGEAALKAMKEMGNHDQKSIANYYLNDVITDKRVTYDKEFLDGINKTLSN